MFAFCILVLGSAAIAHFGLHFLHCHWLQPLVHRPSTQKKLPHRPECRDTSKTFTSFLARTFESSLAKVHKITKKVGQNRSAPLGSFNFTGKRLSLLVSVHMAFVEGMLIKQMRLFLCV